MRISTQAGDTLDLLCYRYFKEVNSVATILHNNPQLAGLDPQGLPAGIVIDLGDVPTPAEKTAVPAVKTSSVFLWD